MTINTIKKTGTANTNYCPNRRIKYIVIHYTAGSTSRTGAARNTAAMFSNPVVGGSADFIVDDTEIVQYSPDIENNYCWHAGVDYSGGTAAYWGKCTNADSIGIEICSTNPNYSPSDKANSPKWSFTDAVVKNAAELVKYLMQKYNIPAENVIRHWDVCHKECPGIIGWNPRSGSEVKWQEFKKLIGSTAAAASTSNTALYRVQCGAFSVKSNADKLTDKLRGEGYKDAFAVKVNGGISDILYRVQCGAFKDKTNAENLKKKLQSAGYKDAFVTTSGASVPVKKTNNEVAKEVIAGKWGNGDERRRKLAAAGYDYNAIQTEVNILM